ncbi:MAG TPA: recombinase family protein [Bryobacteraceae bacterium]
MGKRQRCTKAIAYIRTSTGRQETSPEVQRERIEAYCKMAGLDLAEVIVERGVSAKLKLSKRPAGAKIRALLESGICHVVALKLDRLFRNAIDALATTEEWNEAGISLHLVDMHGMAVDTGSSIGKMFLTMLAAFAEFERNIISERTVAALRHKRAHGQVFNHAPYGFDGVDGALVLNAAEQAILERLKALRKAGNSYSRIAKELNAEDVPSKTGGIWHPFSVQKVLMAAA